MDNDTYAVVTANWRCNEIAVSALIASRLDHVMPDLPQCTYAACSTGEEGACKLHKSRSSYRYRLLNPTCSIAVFVKALPC